MAPVNERALRELRNKFVDAIAFTTAKRSLDLTVRIASYGTDLGPDVQIYIRRAQAYRRAYTESGDNEELIKDILRMYEQK